jgi:uncharacterized protein (TIGR02246 family)
MSRTAKRLLAFACIALGISLAASIVASVRAARRARRSDPARLLAVHAAIARTNEALLEALHRCDPYAYAEHFTGDALSMPGYGPIVRGREAIANAMADTFTKIRFAEAEMSTLDTRVHGETVLETGRYRYVVAASATDERKTLTGRYVIVWKRVGNQWKIALDAAQPGAVPD